MTDVRLTALNPVDSQVYPVACNDKGELLIEANEATGNLNVQGDLTVTGTGTFVNGTAEIQSQGFFVGTGFVSYKMAASSYAIHDDDVNWKYSVYYDGTTHIGGYITTANPADDTPNIALKADGNATFIGGGTFNGFLSSPYITSQTAAGNATLAVVNTTNGSTEFQYVTGVGLQVLGSAGIDGAVNVGGYNPSNPSSTVGAQVSNAGTIVVVRPANATTSPIFQGGYVGSPSTIQNCIINADGSAFFASTVIGGSAASFAGNMQTQVSGTSVSGTDTNFGLVSYNISSSNSTYLARFTSGGGAGEVASIKADGSATFQGPGFFRSNVYIQDGSGSSTRITLENDGNANFAGVVTASNINFLMSQDTLAEMRAVDDGFEANEVIDLLRELIKMKADIKNLNAFMQKSIQESSEIEQ